jgi:hypothetical protein
MITESMPPLQRPPSDARQQGHQTSHRAHGYPQMQHSSSHRHGGTKLAAHTAARTCPAALCNPSALIPANHPGTRLPATPVAGMPVRMTQARGMGRRTGRQAAPGRQHGPQGARDAHSPAKPPSVSRRPNRATKDCHTAASPTGTGMAESTASPAPLRRPAGEHASRACGLFSSPKRGAHRHERGLQRAPAAAAGPGTRRRASKVPTGPPCPRPAPAAAPVTVYSPAVASPDGAIPSCFQQFFGRSRNPSFVQTPYDSTPSRGFNAARMG